MAYRAALLSGSLGCSVEPWCVKGLRWSAKVHSDAFLADAINECPFALPSEVDKTSRDWGRRQVHLAG